MEKYTYSTSGPKCPYCGFQITPDEGFYYDENKYTEETCGECEKKFSVSVYNSTSWTCEPIAENKS